MSVSVPEAIILTYLIIAFSSLQSNKQSRRMEVNNISRTRHLRRYSRRTLFSFNFLNSRFNRDDSTLRDTSLYLDVPIWNSKKYEHDIVRRYRNDDPATILQRNLIGVSRRAVVNPLFYLWATRRHGIL